MPDITFNIPPTKLIQIDIDYHEIGKNYPVEVGGIVADAGSAMSALYNALTSIAAGSKKENTAWYRRFKELKQKWLEEMEEMRKGSPPMGIPNIVKIARDVLPRGAIITLSAGLPPGDILPTVAGLPAIDFYKFGRFLHNGLRIARCDRR